MEALFIKVANAEFTVNKDFGKRMDPYIVIKYNLQQKQTKIAKEAGKYPHFNEDFTFPIGADNVVVFEAFDDDIGRDDFLGKGTLTVDGIKKNGGNPMKVEFEDKDTNIIGFLNIQASLIGKEERKEANFQQDYNLDEKLVQIPKHVSNKQGASFQSLNAEADVSKSQKIPVSMYSDELTKTYEQSGLNEALARGLQEIGEKKPDKPVQYLANFLLNYTR